MLYPYPDVHCVLSRDGKGIHITKDIPVTVSVFDETYDITVRKGFFTDVTSSPLWSRPLVPQLGRYSVAAVVHDWLLKHRMYTRKIADAIFNEMNIRLGVKPWRRKLMYRAVRISGSLRKNRY